VGRAIRSSWLVRRKDDRRPAGGWVLDLQGVLDPRCSSVGIRAQLSGDPLISYSVGHGPRVFVKVEGDEYGPARSRHRRAKFSGTNYLPDVAVVNNCPEVRVMRIFTPISTGVSAGRFQRLVPGWCRCAGRGLALIGRRHAGARMALKGSSAVLHGRGTFGMGEGCRLQGPRPGVVGDGDRFSTWTKGRERPSVQLRCRSSAAQNVRNALAPCDCGGLPASTTTVSPRGLAVPLAGVGKSAGPRCRGLRTGVTVTDDFAHHPTAVAETLGVL